VRAYAVTDHIQENVAIKKIILHKESEAFIKVKQIRREQLRKSTTQEQSHDQTVKNTTNLNFNY